MYVGSTKHQFNVLLSKNWGKGGWWQNMPFTLGFHIPWQRETMIEQGHQRGVAIDATFGTNEKKGDTLCLIHNTCTYDLIH